MKFKSLAQTVQFLDKLGELVRIAEEVDPELEMAEITRRVFDAKGPAILFEKVKGSRFRALSNLFGTFERSLKIFEPQLDQVRALVDLVSDPGQGLKSPGRSLQALPALAHALPLRVDQGPVLSGRTRMDQLPWIRCWPKDGGAFLLLPQVFSLPPGEASILKSNLGMYRIQISGNDYVPNREIGLHYQLHRGIGIHHKQAMEMQLPLRVSIFLGGPPAHALAAVMPLPEAMPEVAFAGALAGRNFRYVRKDGFFISADADFCITGVLVPGRTKPEGPFGDHLGYYSLTHDYPVLAVESIYHRPDAIFPFTVVGRPPQEDSHFGRLIHEITRKAVRNTIPGVTAVNAVDHAGVHPLLLAKAHERYLPYERPMPRELLTHASAILGTGQLSLAKYLFICAHEDRPDLNVNDELSFFIHLLERIDFSRDLHFITRTTMDTLDYSGGRINQGSKLILAAAGPRIRTLATELPGHFSLPHGFENPGLAGPGMAVIRGPKFRDYPSASRNIHDLAAFFHHQSACSGDLSSIPLVVVVDDSSFVRKSFANFLWVTFLRSNPSHDIYGVDERIHFKHWGCDAPLIIDARIKPFHADPLVPDPGIQARVRERFAGQGKPLNGII